MCHRHIPLVAILFAALLSLAADKGKEPTFSAEQIQTWVKQLGDDKFIVREEATKNLIKAGDSALDALTKATRSDDAEVKQRALMIIKHPKKVAIAYFKKLGGRFTVDEKSPGIQVIGLNLDETKITDSGLVHLKRLPRLQTLSLWKTKVTDEGIAHLRGVAALESLNLYQTHVGDESLKHLANIKSLKHLPIGKTKVTDVGLKHVRNMIQLEYLGLRANAITDKGVANLVNLVNLTGLTLGETKITDEGVAHLKHLTKLTRLRLGQTKVTNKSIEVLIQLRQLKYLDLTGSHMTIEGIKRLRKALPSCSVLYETQQ